MKLGPLVPLRPAAGIFALAGAELAKVFGGFGGDVFEELKGDSAERLAYFLMGLVFVILLPFFLRLMVMNSEGAVAYHRE